MHLVGLYTYCKMMDGAYIKLCYELERSEFEYEALCRALGFQNREEIKLRKEDKLGRVAE